MTTITLDVTGFEATLELACAYSNALSRQSDPDAKDQTVDQYVAALWKRQLDGLVVAAQDDPKVAKVVARDVAAQQRLRSTFNGTTK